MSGTSRARDLRDDPTFYPVDDDMGEGLLHRLIGELLRALVERWLQQKGKRALVGANQFIYFEQHNPKACVAPDVYVLDGVDPATEVTSWKVWERGVVPSFAVEVVSEQPQKDYRDALQRYEQLGVPEVVIFDPKSAEGRDRIHWQVWRKGKQGLRQVEVSDGDRVRSRALGCWLRVTGVEQDMRVRLFTGARGDKLVPTEAEEERTRAEEQRTRAEEQRTRAEEAEREVKRLRAELARRPKR
jgi:Uma2 family endonuclease